MASLEKINPLNVPGSLYVDTTCIDCGTCYHLAPEIFKEQSDRSYVDSQPMTPHEWTTSKMAIVSCPTNSIGVQNAPIEFKEAQVLLPHLIAANVHYCGYTAKNSYGASSYLITRPEGNILIDSPRFHPALVKELEEIGGVKYMLLSHKDDVADHALFAAHFNCERIIHQDDIEQETQDIERIISFKKPEYLFADLLIIPTPGHTKGHVVFLYKNEYLFTGDHIFHELDGELRASKNVCWYSRDKQIESTELLLQYKFEWILPGHGGWGYKPEKEMKNALTALIHSMKRK